MRSNRINWIFVVLFFIGGLAFWRADPTSWIGPIWVGASVVVALLLAFAGWHAHRASRVMERHGLTWPGGAAASGTVDLSNTNAGEAVLDALREHGVDPTTGAVDLRQIPAAREAVLRALREHGIDVAHATAANDPNVPISAGQEPMARLSKLEQLRAANLITAEEYDRYRKQILDGV